MPVFASADGFTSLGSTGRTTLTMIDLLSLPALSHADSVLAIAVRPASFGLLELSDVALVAPFSFATLGVRGRATPRWVDIQPTLMRAWHLTPSFRAGVATSIRYTAAPGFAGHVEFLADIHAVVVLDSLWSAACLVSDAVRLGRPFESPLPGPSIHTAVARSIGEYVASLDIALASGQTIGLLFEVAYIDGLGGAYQKARSPNTSFMQGDAIRWRAGFCTAPFTLSGAIAVPLHACLTLALSLAHIEHLGFRTLLGVEFVP